MAKSNGAYKTGGPHGATTHHTTSLIGSSVAKRVKEWFGCIDPVSPNHIAGGGGGQAAQQVAVHTKNAKRCQTFYRGIWQWNNKTVLCVHHHLAHSTNICHNRHNALTHGL